jgi:hypothetical protein
MLPGCTLQLQETQTNFSYNSLEAASAIFPECDVFIPRPVDSHQGLLVTLTRLNIPGNPGNCQDGYLMIDEKLCGKLEEQPRTEVYWPRVPQSGVPVRIHFPTRHPLPMQYSFNIRNVASCYNLTLNTQNGTFSTEITQQLSCAINVHVAFGYRLALSIQVRTDNTDGEQLTGDNIWDEAPTEDYTEVIWLYLYTA